MSMAEHLGPYAELLRSGVVLQNPTTAPGDAPPSGFATTALGLWVPQHVLREPQPIDLVGTYLTAEEIFGAKPPLWDAIALLSQVPVEEGLVWISSCLAQRALGDTAWRSKQHDFARSWFNDSTYGLRAKNLVLNGRRQLLSQQVLLLLARLVLIHGDTARQFAGPGEPSSGRMLAAMLVLGSHLGGARQGASQKEEVVVSDTAPVTRIELEVTANQVLHHQSHLPRSVVQFWRRWIELPFEQANTASYVDLKREFSAATGVSLEDFLLVGIGLISRTINDQPKVPADYFANTEVDPSAVARVMELISATPNKIKDAAGKVDDSLNPEYAFNAFGRYPVIELSDGSHLVMAAALLENRVFGWLPIFDVAEGLRGCSQAGDLRATRAESFLRHTAEAHTVETLQHVATTGLHRGKLFRESEIQAAYGRSQKNADAALAYGDGWIIAEVSTRQVTRQTAAGASASALLKDLQLGILQKVQQIESTISHIHRDPNPLLHDHPAPAPSYFPVLVCTEGFPVNPVTSTRVFEMIKSRGLLAGVGVAPLAIVDVETLEAVETVAASGGPSFPTLLRMHTQSGLAKAGFREWVLTTFAGLRPTDRIRRRFDGIIQEIASRIGPN